MNEFKKGKSLFKKDSEINSIAFVKEGEFYDSNKKYPENSFIGFGNYILNYPLNSKIKASQNSKVMFLDENTEIPEETKEKFMKEISKNLLSMLYFPDLKKFPLLKDVIEYKNQMQQMNQHTDDLDDDEVKEFFDSFDFFMEANEEKVEIDDDFDEFSKQLKKEIIEFNFSKFIVLIKKGVEKFQKEKEWEILLGELLSISINMNDRALSQYTIYISCFVLKDLKLINSFIKKNWEFLRFAESPSWIDQVMRCFNNKMFYFEVDKK